MSYSKAFLFAFLFGFGLYLLYPRLGSLRNLATQQTVITNTLHSNISESYLMSKISLLNIINKTMTILREEDTPPKPGELDSSKQRYSTTTFEAPSTDPLYINGLVTTIADPKDAQGSPPKASSTIPNQEELFSSTTEVINAVNNWGTTIKIQCIHSYAGKLSTRSVENIKILSENYHDMTILCGSSECMESTQGINSIHVTR